MSPEHRRPDGTRQAAHSWESLVERQIREAMEAGAFDHLPHQGVPLPVDDLTLAGEWGLAYKMLRDAGAAPPWVEADKEARARSAAIEAFIEAAHKVPSTRRARLEVELASLVTEANAAIARVNDLAPTDRQHRRLLDPGDIRQRLLDALDTA